MTQTLSHILGHIRELHCDYVVWRRVVKWMIAQCGFLSDLSAAGHLDCAPTLCHCNIVTVLPAADQYASPASRCLGLAGSMVSFYIALTGTVSSTREVTHTQARTPAVVHQING